MADNEKVFQVTVKYTIRVRDVGVTEQQTKATIEKRIFETLNRLRSDDKIDIDVVGHEVIVEQ